MPAETVRCPHCGLTVTLGTTAAGKPTLKYDVDEWRRICTRPHLRSPALCIAERHRSEPPKRGPARTSRTRKKDADDT
jgi:hypothetical protein